MPWVINPNAPKINVTINLDEEPSLPLFDTDANFTDVISTEPIQAIIPGSGTDYNGNVFGVNVPHVAAGKLTIGGEIENKIISFNDMTGVNWVSNNAIVTATTFQATAQSGYAANIWAGVPPEPYIKSGVVATFIGYSYGADTVIDISVPAIPTEDIPKNFTSTPQLFLGRGLYLELTIQYIFIGDTNPSDWQQVDCTNFQITLAPNYIMYKLPDNFTGSIYLPSYGSLNSGHFWPMSTSLQQFLSAVPLDAAIEVTLQLPFNLSDANPPVNILDTSYFDNYRVDLLSFIDARGMLFLDIYRKSNPTQIAYAYFVFSDGVNRAEVQIEFEKFVTYYIRAELDGSGAQMRIGYSTDGEEYTFGEYVSFVRYIPGASTATQVTVGWDEPEFIIFEKITVSSL